MAKVGAAAETDVLSSGGGDVRFKSGNSTVIRVNATDPEVSNAVKKQPEVGTEEASSARKVSPKISRNLVLLENSGIDYGINVVASPTPPPAPTPPSPPLKITHFPSITRKNEANESSNATKSENLNQSIESEESSFSFGKKSPDPIMTSSSSSTSSSKR